MQLKTLIGLRLLLLKRVWLRSAAGVVAGVFAFFGLLILCALAVGVGIGCFALGWEVLPELSPRALMLAADGIVVVVLAAWTMGLMMELQRTDLIDFQKMLYLPVSLRMVFVLNFAVSLSSPMLVIFALGAIGLTAGLTIGVGPQMLWVLPLAAAFYLMLASWSYHLQGLMAALMENKRRRRFILTVIPIVFVVLAQMPNVLTQSAMFGSRQRNHGTPQWHTLITTPPVANQTDWFRAGHNVIPVGWLPRALYAVRQGDFGAAGLCLAGMAGIGALGLGAGYRTTLRQYTGAGRRPRAPEKKKEQKGLAVAAAPFTAKVLPYLQNDTCALVLASWLTLVRHPRIRVQMFMPLLMPILFAVPLAMRHPTGNVAWAGNIAFTGAMFYTFLSFAMFMCNHFGTDQEGFQALVLLPTPRYKYLLAKNLAFFPLVAIPYLILSAVVAYFVRPGVLAYATTLLQFVQVYVSISLLGNYISVYFPYRFQRNAGQAARAKPASFLGGIITMFAIPVLMIPTGLCSFADSLSAYLGVFRFLPLGMLATLLIVGLTVWAYRSTLESTGDLLQFREQSILATLLKDKE